MTVELTELFFLDIPRLVLVFRVVCGVFGIFSFSFSLTLLDNINFLKKLVNQILNSSYNLP